MNGHKTIFKKRSDIYFFILKSVFRIEFYYITNNLKFYLNNEKNINTSFDKNMCKLFG